MTSVRCRLNGFLIGTDGVNDPTIAFYDGSDATGIKRVPSNTYDASALGLNGFVSLGYKTGIEFDSGMYIDISGSNVEVVPIIEFD